MIIFSFDSSFIPSVYLRKATPFVAFPEQLLLSLKALF